MCLVLKGCLSGESNGERYVSAEFSRNSNSAGIELKEYMHLHVFNIQNLNRPEKLFTSYSKSELHNSLIVHMNLDNTYAL